MTLFPGVGPDIAVSKREYKNSAQIITEIKIPAARTNPVKQSVVIAVVIVEV